MSLLRNLGLVTGERRGRSIVHALYAHHLAELLDQAVFHDEHLLGLPDALSTSRTVRPGRALGVYSGCREGE